MQQQIAKLLSKAQQNKCASLRHPTFPRRFSLFLGLLCKRSRAESVAGSLSVDAERGAVAAQGRGHEHAHTVRPGSQHHLPVNQKRFPGEACCVFRPGGSVPAAAIQTRFHERWGGSLYVSGAVGVCGWRGGRGVGRCDEGNAHPFLCRNTRSLFLAARQSRSQTPRPFLCLSKLAQTPRWKIRCRRPPLALFCPRFRPCSSTRPQPPKSPGAFLPTASSSLSQTQGSFSCFSSSAGVHSPAAAAAAARGAPNHAVHAPAAPRPLATAGRYLR